MPRAPSYEQDVLTICCVQPLSSRHEADMLGDPAIPHSCTHSVILAGLEPNNYLRSVLHMRIA